MFSKKQQYARDYQERNKERLQEYRDGRKEETKEWNRIYHQTDKWKQMEAERKKTPKYKATNLAYYIRNRDKILVYGAKRRKTPKYKAWRLVYFPAYWIKNRDRILANRCIRHLKKI